MEKYGTDLSQINASDDQLRTIKELAKEKNIPLSQVKNPSNFKEAEEIITHLCKYGKE